MLIYWLFQNTVSLFDFIGIALVMEINYNWIMVKDFDFFSRESKQFHRTHISEGRPGKVNCKSDKGWRIKVRFYVPQDELLF